MNKNINKHNRGFVALVSAVMISTFLFSAVLQNTNMIAVMFEAENHKMSRLAAVRSALKCLDTAFLELTHDYFFEVGTSTKAGASVEYLKDNCSIISVGDTPKFPLGSGYKTIVVSGNSHGITATAIVQVLLSNEKISLLSENTFF